MSETQLPSREEKRRIAGVNVALTWPSSKSSKDTPVNGVTFLLTGAMIRISEYYGLKEVILEKNHLVVGLFMNPLWPLRNNHRQNAEDVKYVFQGLRSIFKNQHLPDSYSIVGHSMGGKVALLCASLTDSKHVKAILALDPVDMNPVEFTNEDGRNLPLNDGSNDHSADGNAAANIVSQRIPIMLTCTDGGLGISKLHDGEAMHKLHPNTEYHRHEHSGHMAYCDHGGGWAGMLMPDIGTPEGNEHARRDAHELIRQLLKNGGESSK